MTTVERIQEHAASRDRAEAHLRPLIRQAHAEGVTVSEIARAARLSRPTVYRIIRTEGEK